MSVSDLAVRGIHWLRRRGVSAVANRLVRHRLLAQGAKVGSGLRLNGWPLLEVRGSLEIGDAVTINTGSLANPVGGATRTHLYVRKGGRLEIGAGTGLSNCIICCAHSISIGSRVCVGGGTNIYDTDFHSIDALERKGTSTTGAISKPVAIEDDVFIGANSTILKGVTVGARSAIAAGSVVSKSVPPDELWGGNPARKIRSLSPNGRRTGSREGAPPADPVAGHDDAPASQIRG